MRLIDANALMDFITGEAETEADVVIASVCRGAALSMPTIDPIRAAGGCYCRECSFGRKPHAEDMQDGYVYCQEQSKYKSVDDFCSGGEPQEAQDDG